MARPIRFRVLLFATIALACGLGGRVSPAETLQLVNDDYLGPGQDSTDDKLPGFDVEILRQVLATLGKDVSFDLYPPKRDWESIIRAQRDGIFPMLRTSEREAICSFPDEPLGQERWVFFIRTADAGKLKFSSFDDLVGHDVAVRQPVPGVSEQPTMPPELRNFLRQHDNLVETSGAAESLAMLAAGHVDYAVANPRFGMREIAKMGLSEKIMPLLSRSVIDADVYVCFTKARVSPALVDTFSRALREFKQTEAFQAIYQKYFK